MIFFDFGNSSVKVVDYNNDTFSFRQTFFYDNEFENNISLWLIGHEKPDCVYISTVKPNVSDRVELLLKNDGIENVVILNQDKDKIIDIGVDVPERVGLDRLLAAKASSIVVGESIVIDIGSAITIDYVDNSGVFQGGAILPGRFLWHKALQDNACQLPFVSLSQKGRNYVIGKNTEDAIASGSFFGVLGAINNIVAEMTKQISANIPILITGGDYNCFKHKFRFQYNFDSDLVFKGMAFIAKRRMG